MNILEGTDISSLKKPLYSGCSGYDTEVVNDDGCQAALKNLRLHIRIFLIIFYGTADENSIANDEMGLENSKA